MRVFVKLLLLIVFRFVCLQRIYMIYDCEMVASCLSLSVSFISKVRDVLTVCVSVAPKEVPNSLNSVAHGVLCLSRVRAPASDAHSPGVLSAQRDSGYDSSFEPAATCEKKTKVSY